MRYALLWVVFAGCGEAGAQLSDGATVGDAAIDLAAPVPDAGARDLALSDLAGEPGCLPGMARIDNFCVDRWEATVVDLDVDGGELPHSPYLVLAGPARAKAARGVVPQGYISQVQATDACKNAGKRLCSAAEFSLACRGPDGGAYYPYGGTTHIKGNCNEGKGSSMVLFFGNDASKWTYAEFNDPRLNEWDGGLAPTGSYPKCVSPAGVWDCVGNLHEWGSDAADAKGHGRFRGGFYGDAEINGPGCLYVTSAHELAYHDYSTGFRCCMDAMK